MWFLAAEQGRDAVTREQQAGRRDSAGDDAGIATCTIDASASRLHSGLTGVSGQQLGIQARLQPVDGAGQLLTRRRGLQLGGG